jgi:hypothetical protein
MTFPDPPSASTASFYLDHEPRAAELREAAKDRDLALFAFENRVLDLLKRTAKELRPCKACGIMLYFIEHSNGKVAPYTADATNHFVNCPEAKQFRRKA